MTFEEVSLKSQSIIGWTSMDEAALLFKCVQKTPKDAVLVELGTAYGRTTAVMALADRKVITIDNYTDPIQTLEKQEETKNQEILRTLPIEFITGESTEIAKTFQDESIDLIFIDADHKYESVKADIDSWLPRVKKGGMVLFHDYDSWPGVTQAVDEAIKQEKLEKKENAISMLLTIKK